MEEVKKLLEELSLSFGISGFEDEIREKIKELMKPYVDEVKVDRLGNVIGIRRGRSERPKIMLAAHMDQIGFLISHIDDNGFARLVPVGGWVPNTLLARTVKARTKDGRYLIGVIGAKPPHIMKEEEKNQPIKLENLFVDFGFRKKEEAEKAGLEVGIPVILDGRFYDLGNGRIVGISFDDRAGVAVMIRALQLLKNREIEGTIYAVATVQEEVGLRGARTSAFGISPDVGIAIDVTIAADVPGAQPHQKISELGKGPAITVMDATIIGNRKLNEIFEKVAEKLKIPLQKNILAKGGTDAGVIHLSKEGVPSTTLSIPTRYIHSAVEMVDLQDVENAAKLLAGVLEEIKSPEQLLPE